MEIYGDLDHLKALDYLQKWFEDNKKLPKKIDRIHLTRFYFCMFKDVEETKKRLEINYAIRNSNPDLFTNRDPTDNDYQRSEAYADLVQLPGLTPENYAVILLRINSRDPKLMHCRRDSKNFILFNDCIFSKPDLLINDTNPLLSEGFIQIFDMKFIDLGHMSRFSFKTIRIFFKFMQKAYPVRLKAVHIINSSSYVNIMIRALRPFLSKETVAMIHFHSGDLESLFGQVPREMLPEEYGGNAGKVCELKAQMQNIVLEKRDYIMDPNYWQIEKC